jgi:hypothetical protein
MTKQETTTLFEKHDLLLHKLSHQCASRCGRPEDEVYGQACYLFMHSLETYPVDKPHYKLAQWIACVVRNGLIDWAHKYDLPPDPETLPELTTDIPDPSKALMVKEWLAGLSGECREVAMIILDGPAEVLGLGTGMIVPKAVRGALRHYLRSRGWSWPRIWSTFTALKAEVKLL